MEQKCCIPKLYAHIADVKDLFNHIEHPFVLFVKPDNYDYARCYICTSFTLTLNHMLILNLEETDMTVIEYGHGVAFQDAATTADILDCIDEMKINDGWCCFCKLPDGNYAVLTDWVTTLEDECRVINILAMNNQREE